MPLFRHPLRWTGALALSLLLHAAWLSAEQGRTGFAARVPAMATRTVGLLPAPPPALPRPLRPAGALHLPPTRLEPIEPLTPKLDVIPPVRIPPAADWLYKLRQDGREGRARLSWEPSADGRYRLLLTRELDGRALPGWRSEGTLEAQGLAPQRYATQRRGRDAQATNFRRDEGLISFSASRAETRWVAGVQDRISWWPQLAALAAAAGPLAVGDTLSLPVIGLRGEPVDWVFERVDGADGALHLRRAALGPWDGTLDVWLDPARGHLPMRLAVRQADGHGFELERADVAR